MKFYIVDAFTDTPFGGNPAGVVLLDPYQDFPEEEQMRKTAAELRYSETAFVKPVGQNQFHTRYFTPTNEVDLCGHATIAAFTVLTSEGLATQGIDCVNQTLAGNLQIQLEKDLVMMDMASPQNLGTIQDQKDISELYRVMGLAQETVVATNLQGQSIQLFPMIISTGLPDIMLPVSSSVQLSKIVPDFDALSALSTRYNVTGVHAFTLEGTEEGVTCFCRNFAPLYGIPEEAATGTSNGALTYYLYQHNLIPQGGTQRFIQGREMDRPSIIQSRLEIKDAALNIQIGGTGVILAKGSILI